MEATAPASPAPTADVSSAPTSAPVDSAPVVDSGNDQPTEIPRIGESSEVLLSAEPDKVRTEMGEPQAPEPKGLTPEVTDANVSWLEKFDISQELRDNPNISKYKTLDDALNANINLVKKLGEKGIMKPDENADQATWDAWYNHLGRPQTADGYTDYAVPTETDAEGNTHALYELDKDLYQGAKKAFHEAGLDQQQHDAMMNFFTQYELQKADSDAKYTADIANQTKGALSKEWGAEMKAKITTAINVADKLGIKDTLIEKGLGNDYAVIKMLDTIASKVGEAKITGDPSSISGGFEQQLADIKNHPAYHDKTHPDHRALHQRKINLYAKKYN